MRVFRQHIVPGLAAEEPTLRADTKGILLGVLQTPASSLWLPSLLNESSALHRAAEAGDLELCRALVRAGALVGLADGSGRSPEACARAHGRGDVAAFLRGCVPVTATRVGAGDAFQAAMDDRRSVGRVEWYTMPLEGVAGRLGGRHSLLAIAVSSQEEPSNQHVYVVEKASGARDAAAVPEQFRHGVYISHWDDVKGHVDSRYAALSDGQVRPGVTMPSLRELAVRKGPYEVGANNCHHMAQDLFNACARDAHQQNSRPNSGLSRWAWILGKCGIDIAESRCQESGSRCPVAPSLDMQSGSPSHLYDACPFPLEGNCPAEEHRDAKDAALLSDWIYSPELGGLPERLRVEELHRSTATDPVQWASVRKGETCYVVFRGTDLGGGDVLRDLLVDACVMPLQTPSGLHVHSGMWTALCQGALRAVTSRLGAAAEVVLCGHSLGGGYAVLAAGELLHREPGRRGLRVVTFGAPQVVRPDGGSAVWRALRSRARHYVNAWDMVPRLPSCRAWIETLPKLIYRPLSASCAVRWVPSGAVDLERLVAAGRGYDHTGALVFLVRAASRGMLLEEPAAWRPLLDEQPAGFSEHRRLQERVLGFHSRAEYRDIVVKVAGSGS
uniref:Fungal lipase-type domain-containing protein n=1 Tax=Alexandrium monilatum TaxID=311494 RepID=A0A7S4QH90_9DINO